MSFSKLLEPGTIGSMTVKNRMVMPPMVTNFHSEEGQVTERARDYYEARARGGVGLIVIEATCVESVEGKGFHRQLLVDDDRAIPGLKGLTEAIHRHGAKVALQLHHVGPGGSSRITGHQPVGPSAIAPPGAREIPRALTEEEIARLIGCFVRAAARAKEAGFDGVEVHSAHGYLLSSFLFPSSNIREDRYGGSFDNRGRLLVEILAAIRKEVGADYPLWCRIGADAVDYAPMIEKAGANAVHVSVPTPVADPAAPPPMGQPDAPLISVAETAKKMVSIPVIVTFRIEPAVGEAAIRDGKADFIAFGRAALADPEFFNKVASDQIDDIKPCIRCGLCMSSLAWSKDGIICAVNPTLGRERDWAIAKAPAAKKVVVVGGGPAGMEAARVAALRGHSVTLFEKGERLGGQLLIAQLPRYKHPMGRLVDFLAAQNKKLGVETLLNTRATLDLVAERAPGAVVLASGASAFIPSIPGIDGEQVVLAGDVMTGQARVGERVVIIGGELVGSEVGDMLAQAGKHVTVTTLESDVMKSGTMPAVKMSLKYRLGTQNVAVLTGVEYRAITPAGVVLVDNEGNERTIEADTVVLASGMRPSQELLSALKDRIPEVHVAGDCVEPRNISSAVKEGYRAGMSV